MIAVWTRCRTLSFRMLSNQVPLLAPRRARWGPPDRRPAAPGGGSAWPRPLRRGTLASTPNTSICARLRTRSATMMTRASLDPIFLQKMRKRFRGDRPPDERACEYSTSCIDMRADEVLISAMSDASRDPALGSGRRDPVRCWRPCRRRGCSPARGPGSGGPPGRRRPGSDRRNQ